MVASRKRRVLAVFLDAYLFYSLVGAATLQQPLSQGAVFALGNLWLVLEIGLYRSGYSPGFSFLAMSRRHPSDSSFEPTIPCVDLEVARSESKFTLLMGVLFVLDGWSMLRSFGPPAEGRWRLIKLILGTGSIAAGYLVFHLRRLALGFGLTVLGAILAGVLASWDATVEQLRLADPMIPTNRAILFAALGAVWVLLRGLGMLVIRKRLTR